MTSVTRFERKSRLSQLIDAPGGISVGVALAQAERNVAELRGRSLDYVAERVADLAALSPPASDCEVAPRLQQIYHAAIGVIDAAAPFDLADLCTAAQGLCDLADGGGEGALDWRAVTVHVRALQLFVSLPEDAREARDEILMGLRAVVERKVGPAQPAG